MLHSQTHLIWEESSHSCSLFCLSQQEEEKEHIVFPQTICTVWASGCPALVPSPCQCGCSAEPLKGESSRPNKGQSMAACVCSQDCPTTSIVSFRITDSLCHMKGHRTDERENGVVEKNVCGVKPRALIELAPNSVAYTRSPLIKRNT